MALSFDVCINKLREELTTKLKEKYPNRNGGIIIKKSTKNINDNASFVLADFEKHLTKLDSDDSEHFKLNRYLIKIDEDIKDENIKKEKKFPFTISSNSLKLFLNKKVSTPQIENLHTYALYLGYKGWYHFEDEVNKKELVEKKDNEVQNKISPISESEELNINDNRTYTNVEQNIERDEELLRKKIEKKLLELESKFNEEDEEYFFTIESFFEKIN